MRAADNPFRVQCIDHLPLHPRGWDWPELLRRLREAEYRGAIVGPHGSGKTTLLGELTPRLEAEGLQVRGLRLHDGMRRLPSEVEHAWLAELDTRTLLVLDGAEQLGRLAWWRLRQRSRSAGGLLITTHRPGRLPTLLTTSTSPELLASLIDDLLRPLAPPQAANLRLRLPDAAQLYARHDGNLRLALRELYDHCASRGAARSSLGTAPGARRARICPG